MPSPMKHHRTSFGESPSRRSPLHSEVRHDFAGTPADKGYGLWSSVQNIPEQRSTSKPENVYSKLAATLGPRPQLPFLYPATGRRIPLVSSQSGLQYQLSRLITTERKLYFKDQLWKGAKWSVYGWMGLTLISVMSFGLQSELAERHFPSPPEWSFRSRTSYRMAKTAENPDPNGTGLVDWAYIGQTYRVLIERLENPTIDGQGLRPILQEEGDIYVAGVGKAGFDVSSKSEPWRRGYHTCLMGGAKAAENRDGWVRDTTTNICFPPEVVIGPSNPRPKPVPFGAKDPPHEKDCVPVFEPADVCYMKILTTHGFSSRQRLEAALAYADWLDFKGLPSTAEDMCDWGLDIAMGAIPEGTNNVVDVQTGVIDSKATHVSSNILLATTSLAVHHARNENLAAALPIFLSILRARRQLSPPKENVKSDSKAEDQSSMYAVLSLVKSMLVTPPYPPAPPTGDEIPERTSAAVCEEAGLMSHIGEILFASSSASPSSSPLTPKPPPITTNQLKAQQDGLSWTREAVDLAEATMASAQKDDAEAREKCSECLAVGMENWSTMVSKMLNEERRAAKSEPTVQKKTGSWFWGASSHMDGEARWERESKLVDERLARVQRLLNNEADRKASTGLFLFS
ncbi:hypothetical protein ACLMJK_009043 [Lecanora helva]